MRILHTEASCGWGGQEIRILSEAQGLIERGHDVRLVCPPEARIFQEASRFGVPVEALPIGRKRVAGVLALRAYLKRHVFDVINTHSSTDTWLVALACRLISRAPPIVRTRHISAPLGRQRGNSLALCPSHELYRDYRRSAARAVADHLVHCPRAHCFSADRCRCRTLPPCRCRRTACPALSNWVCRVDAPLVGIVATLRSWKGHRFLVEAFAGDCHRSAHFVIVGDGPQLEALTAQIAQLGLQDRVHLVGNHPDVVPWLQALDVFVLPSYANEGVPQALMQAMSCGLPCVTTNIGAIPELARHDLTAWVVPAQDADAIRLAIVELLADQSLRSRLGMAAREHVVATHGRALMLDRMEALFHKAVEAS